MCQRVKETRVSKVGVRMTSIQNTCLKTPQLLLGWFGGGGGVGGNPYPGLTGGSKSLVVDEEFPPRQKAQAHVGNSSLSRRYLAPTEGGGTCPTPRGGAERLGLPSAVPSIGHYDFLTDWSYRTRAPLSIVNFPSAPLPIVNRPYAVIEDFCQLVLGVTALWPCRFGRLRLELFLVSRCALEWQK